MVDHRLYVSDLDGTLLRPDRTLGPRTRRAIARFVAAGGRFTVATGRSAPSTAGRLEGLELGLEAIVHNGALTADLSTGAVSDAVPMPGDAAAALFSGAVERGLCPVAYALPAAGDAATTLLRGPGPNAPTRRYLESVDGMHEHVVLEHGAPLADGLVPLALIVLDAPGRIAELFARHCGPGAGLVAYPGHSAYTPGLGVGEVTALEAGKSRAAARLARDLGLAGLQDVVAFGDNHNDLPLLHAAGEALCPHSADPEVLAQIPGRVDSAAREGVARYLERLL